METLPPEMILNIYKYLDGVSARKFSATCRDYNRIYKNNGRHILYPLCNIELMFGHNVIEIIESLEHKRQKTTFITIFEASRNSFIDDHRSLSFLNVLAFQGRRLVFCSSDKLKTLRYFMEEISKFCEINNLKITSAFDNRALLACTQCISRVRTLSFDNCIISVRDKTLWASFLELIAPLEIKLSWFEFQVPPIFTDDIMRNGLRRLRKLEICQRTPHTASHHEYYLMLQQKSIRSLFFPLISVRFYEGLALIERIQGWLDDKLKIDAMSVPIRKDQIGHLKALFDPEGTSTSSNVVQSSNRNYQCVTVPNGCGRSTWIVRKASGEVKKVEINNLFISIKDLFQTLSLCPF